MENSYSMSGKIYETLYAKYLSRSPRELLDTANMKEGESVLDLCCGSNLRASIEATHMGASSVISVDMNESIHDFNHPKIHTASIEVGEFLKQYHSNRYDVVICQQGINYWFSEENIENLVKIMANGSRFVFNTFGWKPPDYPRARSYIIDNRKYVESSYLLNDIVYHAQYCTGFRPHYTSFRWISEVEFCTILDKYFDNVEFTTNNSTVIYKCEKSSS